MIDNYNDLPLGLYEKALDIKGDEDEVTLGVLALLSGHTVDELMTMPIEDYWAIRAQGAFLLLQPEPQPIRRDYAVGDFILQPIRDVRDMTAAQFIDFQEWSKQPGRHLAEVLSCFLVPKGKPYGEDYDALAVIDAIRDHLSVADAVSLDAFFFSLSIRSIHASLSSLMRMLTPREQMTKTARTMRKALRALRKSGDGWRRWTPLLSLPTTLGTPFIPSE